MIEDSEAELKRIEDEAKEAPTIFGYIPERRNQNAEQTEVNTDGQQRQEA